MKRFLKNFSFTIIICSGSLFSQDLPITIKTDSLLFVKSFTYSNEKEEYRLELYLNELNRGILRYRYKGDTALADQIPVLKIILKSVFQDSSAGTFHTLSWGRLSDDQNKDYTLARRLALAAAHSTLWDSKKGKPVDGNINTFVKNLANREMMYPELKNLFAAFSYSVTFSSAEKVLVLPASDIPFWKSLADSADEKAKLPFDCQTWFSLSKTEL